MRHVFISPHLDDAALSAGNLIIKLLKKGEKIRIITVFTDFGTGPMHWNAFRYVVNSGALTAAGFGRLRLAEDKLAMEKLGVSDYHYLDFTDAYFRIRSSGEKLAWLGLRNCFLYPDSATLFSGKLDREDNQLPAEVFGKLKQLASAADTVYGPLAIGGHVDHIIVNQAAKKLKNAEKYFWLDLPYAVKPEFNGNLNEIIRSYRLKFSPKVSGIKHRVLEQYRSQSSCQEEIKLKSREEFYESFDSIA